MRSSAGLKKPSRWVPSPLLMASGALHAGAAVALCVRPSLWPWALGAVALDHATLTLGGLWPRSRLLGPNWTTLPASAAARGEVAITIDDGPDPDVTPQVLSQLAAHGAPATFFCVGERVLRHAELAQEIARLGHTVENHSQHHRRDFSLLGPRAMESEIARAQESIVRTVGREPRFFRAPAGLRNPFLDPILSRLDLELASWSHRGFDTVDRRAERVLARLTRRLQGGALLLLHDGHAARGATGVPVILEVLPRLLDWLAARDLKPVPLRAAQ